MQEVKLKDCWEYVDRLILPTIF